MKNINKIIGVGMSKTGTTTLAACLDILSIGPHKSYDKTLKSALENNDIDAVLGEADKYKSFEDSPWYHVYAEMDKKYPNSKFILTERKDSYSHAKSSWYHGVGAGVRKGEPTEDYINDKIKIYEEHNNSVRDYFKERPDDLLCLCWEKGDGWEKLCEFLGENVPDVPIPRTNTGGYRKNSGAVKSVIKNMWVYALLLRIKHIFVGSVWFQKIKHMLHL